MTIIAKIIFTKMYDYQFLWKNKNKQSRRP